MKEQLRIEAPCPMFGSRMKPTKNGKLCSTCKEEVIDFTNYTTEEIIHFLKNRKGATCGTFKEEQLTGQKELYFSTSYKLRFALLTFVAFLGFNVSPIQAQHSDSSVVKTTTPIKENTVESSVSESEDVSDNDKKNTKRRKRIRLFRRRVPKGRIRVTGCPSF